METHTEVKKRRFTVYADSDETSIDSPIEHFS